MPIIYAGLSRVDVASRVCGGGGRFESRQNHNSARFDAMDRQMRTIKEGAAGDTSCCRGQKKAGKKSAVAGKSKAKKHLYLVLYNSGEWERSCLSLAMGTYEGAEIREGKLVTLKRHGDTKFKSDHPSQSVFALPDGLKFRGSFCVRENYDLKRASSWMHRAWTSLSINTYVSLKPIEHFVDAEVAFREGSEEWSALKQRFNAM